MPTSEIARWNLNTSVFEERLKSYIMKRWYFWQDAAVLSTLLTSPRCLLALRTLPGHLISQPFLPSAPVIPLLSPSPGSVLRPPNKGNHRRRSSRGQLPQGGGQEKQNACHLKSPARGRLPKEGALNTSPEGPGAPRGPARPGAAASRKLDLQWRRAV